MLYHLYGDELDRKSGKPAASPSRSSSSTASGGRAILQKCGGVLIADGVGLGKTFLAGELIRLYREHRQRILLVCPAALRDSTWHDFLNRFQLFVTCVSYEELAGDRQLGGTGSDCLRNPLEEFALVVVDEAHNYRNPASPARAGVLRRLLSGPRRDLVLMSATPVNNSLWDLYHLLRFFLRNDAFLADRGVLSLHDRFEDAMRADPSTSTPTCSSRSSTPPPSSAPATSSAATTKTTSSPCPAAAASRSASRARASSISYDLDSVLPGFLDRLEQALDPPDGPPQLTLARYQPENYAAGQPPAGADRAIVGLIRSGLLKRFESGPRLRPDHRQDGRGARRVPARPRRRHRPPQGRPARNLRG